MHCDACHESAELSFISKMYPCSPSSFTCLLIFTRFQLSSKPYTHFYCFLQLSSQLDYGKSPPWVFRFISITFLLLSSYLQRCSWGVTWSHSHRFDEFWLKNTLPVFCPNLLLTMLSSLHTISNAYFFFLKFEYQWIPKGVIYMWKNKKASQSQ